jgi:hypothetical protein
MNRKPIVRRIWADGGIFIRLSPGDHPVALAVQDHRKAPPLYSERYGRHNFHRLHIGPWCLRLWTRWSRQRGAR